MIFNANQLQNSLLGAKRKRNSVILSSGATNIMEVRSPADVQNLSILFGLNGGKDCISGNVKKLLGRAHTRKNTFKGVTGIDCF